MSRPKTERNIEIIRLISIGCSHQEIGEALGMAPSTVDAQVQNMRRKYDCFSIPHLVATFFRKGLIEVNDEISLSRESKILMVEKMKPPPKAELGKRERKAVERKFISQTELGDRRVRKMTPEESAAYHAKKESKS